MADGFAGAPPGFRPLYRQVKALLIQRISDRQWLPGQAIPAEPIIAAELGVSQGTVRKALDEMAAENVLVRRQGRGTYVARHDEARILFQFFKIVPDGGVPVFPDSRLRSVTQGVADAAESRALALAPAAPVIRIARLREIAGVVAISEYLTLPAALFPDFPGEDVPNNLYDFYAARFGITISGGQERVKAVAASSDDAAHLGLVAGAPVLLIDRIAHALDGTRIEWRRSYCSTEACSYVGELK